MDCGIRYDLKGSILSRTRLTEGQTVYEGRDINVSLKCNDFREHQKKIELVECFKPDMPKLAAVLSSDVHFLTSQNLIDYSFLLGEVVGKSADQIRTLCKKDPAVGRGVYRDVNGKIWLMGIIDPLNVYDYSKMAEYYYKLVKTQTTDMSCVPPHLYFRRFLDFLNESLIETTESQHAADNQV